MGRTLSRDLAEAEDLLEQVRSWSEKEVNQLPKLYREKAREYRELSQQGEG
jgi:Tfp pilus assembly protein PilP